MHAKFALEFIAFYQNHALAP